MLMPQELEEIQVAFERIIEPYVNRQKDAQPDLRKVRILSYFLPWSETGHELGT